MSQINNLHVLLLNRIGEVGQNEIARVLEVNESTMSRIKNGESGLHLAWLQAFFDSLGLKVVAKDAVTMNAEEVASLRYLAGRFVCGEKK